MIKDTHNICFITKQCNKCEQAKPLTEFYISRTDKDGCRGVCKACWAEYAKQYGLTKNGKIKRREASIRYHLSRKGIVSGYNITLAEYDEMFEKQNGNCAICELPEITRRLSIDHNHKTGKVRGLLCSRCNILLGIIEGSSKLLPKAIEYMNKRHSQIV